MGIATVTGQLIVLQQQYTRRITFVGQPEACNFVAIGGGLSQTVDWKLNGRASRTSLVLGHVVVLGSLPVVGD
jgi:hypothetical protein